jgi:hypothetical protein
MNILALKGEVRQSAGMGRIGETYTFIQLHSHIPIKPSNTPLVVTLIGLFKFKRNSESKTVFNCQGTKAG